MSVTRCESGLLASRIAELLILIRRFANYVARNTLKKKTSIGHAGHTDLSMEERCGGAVEKLQKTLLAASIQSIIARRTRMKMRLENRALLTDRQMKITVRKPTFVVSAAKRRVTLSMSA